MKFEVLPNKKKRITIALVIVGIISIIGIATFSLTRAKYQYTKSIPLIRANNISYSKSDLDVVAIKLKDGENYTDTDAVPTSGYILNTTESICKDKSGNKIDTTFEYEGGKVKIPVAKKGTKCTLVFDKHTLNAAEYLIAKNEMVHETFEDNGTTIDTGYRYEGANPNNYVTFNNELWRIIGVFDTVNADTSRTESLVKLIRNESIGNIVWNTNDSNDWSQSSLRALLNEGDYYNRSNTYSTNGLTTGSKSMIQNVVWNLGSGGFKHLTAQGFYKSERGTVGGDSNPALISMPGYVGLMYASDYGYAVDSIDCPRTTFLSSYMADACKNSNWLYNNSKQWTIVPATSSYGRFAFPVVYYEAESVSYYTYIVRPTIYLKLNVKILDNGKDGSSSKPYDLSL